MFTSKEKYYENNIISKFPSYDGERINNLSLDKSFIQHCGKIIDDFQFDIDKMLMLYWLSADLLSAPIKNGFFDDSDDRQWTNIISETSGLGKVTWGQYVLLNPFYNPLSGTAVDVGDDYVIVDIDNKTEYYTIDEINADSITDVHIGDVVQCVRLYSNLDESNGNVPSLNIDLFSAEYGDEIGVEQKLSRTLDNSKINVKYRVNLSDSFEPSSELLDFAGSKLKPSLQSISEDQQQYISEESIKNRQPFVEFYNSPHIVSTESLGFNGGYVFTNFVSSGFIAGTNMSPCLNFAIEYDGIDVVANLYTPYTVYSDSFNSSDEYHFDSDTVFSFTFWDDNHVSNAVSTTFLTGDHLIDDIVEQINNEIGVSGQNYCHAFAEDNGGIMYLEMMSTHNLFIDQSAMGIGEDLSFVEETVKLAPYVIADKINSQIKNTGIDSHNLYIQDFPDGILRIYSDKNIKIIGGNYNNVNYVLGFPYDDTLTEYTTEKSIFMTVRDDIISKMSDIDDNPKLNLRGKILSNSYDKGIYDSAIYYTNDESTIDLYIERLNGTINSESDWQFIVEKIEKGLTINDFVSKNNLYNDINSFYDYYKSFYNVWRIATGYLYNRFDAVEVTVSGGKVNIDITDVNITWIQNPYINYIAHLLGWDIDSYSADISMIDDTNFVRSLIHLYKSKGTSYSFDVLFNMMGFDVVLQELYRGFPLDGDFRNKGKTDAHKNAFYDTKPFDGVYCPDYYTQGSGKTIAIKNKWNNNWQKTWKDSLPSDNDTQVIKEAYQYLQLLKNNAEYRHGGGWYLNKSNRARLYIIETQWRQLTESASKLILKWIEFLKPVHIIWEEVAIRLQEITDKIINIKGNVDVMPYVDVEDSMYRHLPLLYQDTYFYNKYNVHNISSIVSSTNNTITIDTGGTDYSDEIIKIIYIDTAIFRKIIDHDTSTGILTIHSPDIDLSIDKITILTRADKGVVIKGHGRDLLYSGNVLSVDTEDNIPNIITLDGIFNIAPEQIASENKTYITISSGKGIGQTRQIIEQSNDSNGKTTYVVDNVWKVVPDSTSEFKVASCIINGYYDYATNNDGEWYFDYESNRYAYTGTTEVVKGWKCLYDGCFYHDDLLTYQDDLIDYINDETVFGFDTFGIFYGQGVLNAHGAIISATLNTLTIDGTGSDGYILIEGDIESQPRKIISYTSGSPSTLTLENNFDTIPDASSKFVIAKQFNSFGYVDYNYLTSVPSISKDSVFDTLTNGIALYGNVEDVSPVDLPDIPYSDSQWNATRPFNRFHNNLFDSLLFDSGSFSISDKTDYIFSPFCYDRVTDISAQLLPADNIKKTYSSIMCEHTQKKARRLLYTVSSKPIGYDIKINSEYFGKVHDIYYNNGTEQLWPAFVIGEDSVKDGIRKILFGRKFSDSEMNSNLLWLIDRYGYNVQTPDNDFRFVIWTYEDYTDDGIPSSYNLDNSLSKLETKAWIVKIKISNSDTIISLSDKIRAATKEIFKNQFTSGSYFSDCHGDGDLLWFCQTRDNQLKFSCRCDFMILPNKLNKVLGLDSWQIPNKYLFYYLNVCGNISSDSFQVKIENNTFSRWRNADTGNKQRNYLRYDEITSLHNNSSYDVTDEQFISYGQNYYSNNNGRPISLVIKSN